MCAIQRIHGCPALCDGVGKSVLSLRKWGLGALRAGKLLVVLAVAAMIVALGDAQQTTAAEGSSAAARRANLPPRVAAAERFLAQRGWNRDSTGGGRQAWAGAGRLRRSANATSAQTQAQAQAQGAAIWQPLGPTAVQSQNFGLVTGRISALALDPSDTTGNTLYVGTTGGGVWRSQNANSSSPANITFTALTDDLSALSGAADASISIGALTVQPGGTGVILAGTGDPNDALDSYYGAGILRSTDSGTTWSLISMTSLAANQVFSFAGEGFAGFAWSTVNPQRVVAAVSQAYEGILVNASRFGTSYEGLYYSSDSGATWSLATITDGTGTDVQGPNDIFAVPDGNAATSVVWNPVRQLFVAAVRYHGYYQSTDGITWTRMSTQPGSGLAALAGHCPTNPGFTGSPYCPIFRGTLAVNPLTGDTFAWTVDEYNQDQGLWQDQCAASAGACASQTITFAQQWGTAALETNTSSGPATIENGDYNLALAAIPSGQGTMLLAGANDLWKTTCPSSQGCSWRNTTNSTAGFCAGVGEYQHALAWNVNNPLEIFVGNDSGLWRSTDAIGETGSVCSPSDASHFQNLNGSLGSLAGVASISQVGDTPYTMMAGLGANGIAGVNSRTGTTAEWPEILSGEGGPVAIDPKASSNWYANNGAGVSIYLGTPPAGSTPGAFNPVLNVSTDPGAFTTRDADVVRDGLYMAVEPPYAPAPFLVDPLDNTQLLIGTCRVWRGPANGEGWSAANAISSILDGITGDDNCSVNALIRSMAAMVLPASTALPSGGEIVYVGMYGQANGGATLPGHVKNATYNSATGSWSGWADVTALNPVSNDTRTMNYYGLDISSIFIDPHDTTGLTVYVTVAGIPTPRENVQTVYGSTDGGVHWTSLMYNLPASPANSLVVDPQSASTVYVATDDGVYATQQIGSCTSGSSGCWSAYGSGLPEAPVVELRASPASASVQDLVAATYGRGIWATSLLTATVTSTTATVTPASLTFASQAYGSSSSAQIVTLQNTGSIALTPTFNSTSGDFSMTGNCQGATVAPGGSCTIQVTFAPTQLGSRTGLLTISANITGGQLTVSLSGIGASSGAISLTPATISFGSWEQGSTSTPLQVTVTNSTSSTVPITSAITGPFSIASNSCGSSLPASGSCQLELTFTPTQSGAASGTLTFTDADGTQTAQLSGTGLAAPTDTLSATSLAFPNTVVNQLSAAQTATLTNSGGVNLTSIAVSVSGAFQMTNGCGAILAPNANCTVSVQFYPTATGYQTGTLTIQDELLKQTVALSGTGIAPPAFSVNPPSLTFAGQQVSVASLPQTLTVTNTGGAPLNISGFQMSGSSAASFSCGTTVCSATTCGTTLSNVAGQNSCTVQVTFTPSVAGGNTAALVISSSNAVPNTISVPLSGTGQTPAGLSVNPAQLAFPVVSPGQSSPTQTVIITNTGGLAANSLTLTATLPFSLVQNACPVSLAAGASCSTGVVFSPSLNGPYAGTLTIASPSLAASASVPLSGTGGTLGSVQAQPSLIAFSQTGVGLVSSPVTVTFTNPSGNASLTSFTVAATAGFKVVSNTCASTLESGASCTVGVEFAPTSAGAQNGSLTVSSSALTTGAFVPLSGMGFDFSIAPSGSSSQTIANGQTADYKLVIEPLLGSQGVFTFQCSSLPPYASCTFNPTSEGIPADLSGNLVVEIATGLSQTSARSSRPSPWPVLPLLCGLVLVPFGLRRRRNVLLLVALLAILAGGVSSCATSGVISAGKVPSTGSGITSPGTFPVVVTATSNGVQHQVTLTLIVD